MNEKKYYGKEENNKQAVFGENPSEQEVNQEIIYNLVSYLPLNEMKIQDGDKISYIVKTARDYKNANGKVEDGALETLEACLKEESGISDIGNAKIYYTSFNKNTNDLIAHGVTRKEADTITDAKAISAAVFIYKGSERQGIKEGVSMVFRGTPRAAWSDNANMESDCTGHFQKDGFTYERISPLDRASLLNMQDTLRQIEEGDDETARVCRQFMQENKLVLSAHSQGGKRAVTAKGVFPELQNTRCYVFDAPGIPPEHWDELVQHWGAEKVEEMRNDIYSIYADNDIVHGIGYTEQRGYFARNQMALDVPEVDNDRNANVMAYHYAFRLLHIDGDGSVRLQEKVEKEGNWAEYAKVVSDELMKLPPDKRADLMHPTMALIQVFHANSLPHNYNFIEHLKLGGRTMKFLPDIIPLLHFSAYRFYSEIYSKEHPFERWPAGAGEIVLKLKGKLPKDIQNGLNEAGDAWNKSLDFYREGIGCVIGLPGVLSRSMSKFIVEKLEATKQLADNDGIRPNSFYRDEGGLPMIRHDQTFNRCTIGMLQFGIEAYSKAITGACDWVKSAWMDVTQAYYLDDYRVSCNLNYPFKQVSDPISGCMSRGGYPGLLRFQAPPSLALSKNVAYVCRSVDQTIGSCEESCYPLFWIPAGAQYPWKLAELLRKQHTAEIQAGVDSLKRDKAALESCILETCGISTLEELKSDMSGKRPLFALAKRVLYDARETEEILLHYAARLEKGLQAQFACLPAGSAAGEAAKLFDTEGFLAKEPADNSSTYRGEVGISYADAGESMQNCEEMALQCNYILSDIGELRHTLSGLRYVSVSHDGLDEMTGIINRWRAQQLHHREALGTYMRRCQEAETAFCECCNRIAVN